ncbi:hypothetical protein APHAL10511_006211 [Amanita phalloides]|nr:hypothetical protein APHAL10511_006211 [Amanita phalloides]
MGKSGKQTKKPLVEDDEVYHVEVITKARVVREPVPSSEEETSESESDGKRKGKARWQYFVKWAGYDSDANSWEPEENVANCQRLLASFWEHIGVDDKDYNVGYEVEADEQWIKKEKKFFAREYHGAQEQMRKQNEQHEHKPRQIEKTKKYSAGVSRPSTSSSTKGKAKASEIELTSSSESEDDQPLSQTIPSKRKVIQISSSEDEHSSIPAPPSKVQKTTSRRVTVRDPVQEGTVDSLFTPSPDAISIPEPLPSVKIQPIPLPLPTKKSQFSHRPPKRPYNQHVSIAAGSLDFTASASSISTKQRLAQQALNLVLPRGSLTDSDKAKLPSAASTKQALTSLTFKKSALTMQSPQAPFASTESIIGISIQTNIPFASSSRTHVTGSETLTPVQAREDYSGPHATAMEVDSFLNNIMPPELAAPIVSSPQTEHGPLPPKALLTRMLPPPTKIPKKWKWSGPLVLEYSDGRNECINVMLQDCTEPTGTGLRFSIIMTGVEELVAPSFHDFIDMLSFLRACKSPSQHGRIFAQTDHDAASLTTLSIYMGKMKQVIVIPATLDNDVVGHLLLFSPDSELCRKLNVPSDLRQSRSLVVTLVAWELSPKQLALDFRKPVSGILPKVTNIDQTIEDTIRWERSIRTKVSYHHALRVLKFPKALHDFMTHEHKRPFCVWWDSGDNTNAKSHPGIETMYLLSIMEQCRAGNVGLKSVARVVFVHVGALKTVHKMPQFMDRRANHPLVQFYTYGTHESVGPGIWGVREIWPCGGVVTFMPQAALDDFFGLLHRIRQIYAHPLWASYVIPSAIGMMAKLICGNDDPLAVFDRGDFFFKDLLTAIAEGELAMLTAPRNDQHSTSANEVTQQWVNEYVLSSPDSEREILQYAVASFNAKFSNIHSSEWTRVIAEELSADLSYMHRQPTFMRNNRRYVVLRGHRQEISLPDGFEWVTTSDFDFRDEFFRRQ